QPGLRIGVAETAAERELELGGLRDGPRDREELALDVRVGGRYGRRTHREVLDAGDEVVRPGPTLLDGAREQRHGGRAQRLAEDIRHDTRARVDGCRGVSQRAPQLRRLTDEVRRGEQLAG